MHQNKCKEWDANRIGETEQESKSRGMEQDSYKTYNQTKRMQSIWYHAINMVHKLHYAIHTTQCNSMDK